MMLAQLGYSRERRAPGRPARLELLKGAGIAPKGLANFFTRVTKMEAEDRGRTSAAAFNWLRTHPPAAERAEARAPATRLSFNARARRSSRGRI